MLTRRRCTSRHRSGSVLGLQHGRGEDATCASITGMELIGMSCATSTTRDPAMDNRGLVSMLDFLPMEAADGTGTDGVYWIGQPDEGPFLKVGFLEGDVDIRGGADGHPLTTARRDMILSILPTLGVLSDQAQLSDEARIGMQGTSGGAVVTGAAITVDRFVNGIAVPGSRLVFGFSNSGSLYSIKGDWRPIAYEDSQLDPDPDVDAIADEVAAAVAGATDSDIRRARLFYEFDDDKLDLKLELVVGTVAHAIDL